MIASASCRERATICADSVFSRSSSCRACWASSSDLRIAFWRVSSASSSGRHANFASSASSTRKVTIVQMKSPGSVWTNGLSIALFSHSAWRSPERLALRNARAPTSLQQHDQQREHLGENRDAFQQEERQVDGAGDLRGGARL